jgi:hypothetical protein
MGRLQISSIFSKNYVVFLHSTTDSVRRHHVFNLTLDGKLHLAPIGDNPQVLKLRAQRYLRMLSGISAHSGYRDRHRNLGN